MRKKPYDLTTLEDCKALIERLADAIDHGKFSGLIRANFPEGEAENLLAEYGDNIQSPLKRAQSLLIEATSVTGRTTAKQKLDYAKYRQGQPRLSQELKEAFDENLFRIMGKTAKNIAHTLSEKINELDDVLDKAHHPTAGMHSNPHLLAQLHEQLEDIGNLASQSATNFDVMNKNMAMNKLYTQVQAFESRVQRGQKKG